MTSKLYKFADKVAGWIEKILSYEKPRKVRPYSKLTLRNCKFKFKCTQTWESLEETNIATTKHCNVCHEWVYLVETDKRLVEAIKLNQCVAIKKELEIYVGSIRPPEEYNRMKVKQ